MQHPHHQLRSKISQNRSNETADIIFQAAGEILEAEESFNIKPTKDLAARAGVSVGSIYRYFKDKNDLYAKSWSYFVLKQHRLLIEKLVNFPKDGTLDELMPLIVNHYIDAISKKRGAVFIPVFRLFIKTHPEPEAIQKNIDEILLPLMHILCQNHSNTMKVLSQDELRLYLRAGQAMIRSSYLERDPYFGTPSHRVTTSAALIKLFSK
jgi:AcrR family transcriptional regulator